MAKVDQQIKDLRNTQELLQAETVSLRQRIARLWEAILSVITHPPDDVIIADGRTVEPATDGQANLGTAAKPFGVVYANSFTNPGGEVVATEITDQDGGANIKAARSATVNMLLALDASGEFPVSVIPSGVDHGGLAGLGDDDHTQYHNDARGDARYYTETELDAGQLDNRYYTETELDAGQLDNRYFTEAEHLNTSAGAGDAGKPVKLDAAGHIDATMINDADIDHGSIGGLADDDHTQYFLLAGETTDAKLYSGADLIVYSDAGVSEKARIDGATGNITTAGTVDGVDLAGFNAAQFVALVASGHMANERVLTAGDGLDLSDGGAGAAVTLAVDVTDILGSGLTESSNNIDLNWGTPTIGTIEPDDAASAGTSTNPARSDHQHAIVCAAPGANSVSLSASAEGSASSFARSDHTHNLDESITPTWTGAHAFGAGLSISTSQGITMADDTWIGIGAALERIVFDAAGDISFMGANVGIGTAGPNYLLELHSASGSDSTLALSDTDVAHGMTAVDQTDVWARLLPLSSTAGGVKIRGLSDADATAMEIQALMGSDNPTDATPALIFKALKKNSTTVQGLSATETAFRFQNNVSNLVTILGSGNVGIGTTEPGEKLEVDGNIYVTGGDSSIVANQEWANLTFYARDISGLESVGAGAAIVAQAGPWTFDGSNRATNLLFKTTDDSHAEDTRMFIKYNGNILIGTTTHTGGRLEVQATTEQLRLEYDASHYASFTVGSGGNLTVAPTGDFIFDPAGNDVLPETNYDLNLGSLSKKYLTLHAAELWVETLVAQDTIATIGGRILVGPTTVLTSDLAPAGTTIYVKHNEMASGDTAYLEADGKVEFVSIDSAPGGAGPYSYTVTRNLDGSGANQWYAGDAMFNTGTTGDGFIDLYSVRGVKAAAEYGPAIVGNIRNSTTYNNWSPHWAIGNLNGVYGYGVATYGVALGKYAAGENHITIETTNGIRFFEGAATVIAQWNGTTITLGQTAAEHVNITSTAVQIKDGATVYTELVGGALILGDDAGGEYVHIDSTGIEVYGNAVKTFEVTSTGLAYLGDQSNEHIKLSSSGLQVYDGAILYATYGATTTIGLVASEHISITSTAVQFKDGANVYTDLSGGVLTLGLTSGGEYMLVDSTGIEIYGGAVKRVEITSAGVGYFGDQANEHVKVSTSGMQVYDGATLLATYGASTTFYDTGGADRLVLGTSGITVGDVTEGEYLTVDATNGVRLYGGGVLHGQLTNAGTFWFGDTSASERLQWDSANGLIIYNASNTAVISFDTGGNADITGKLRMPGASSAIAIGATPPTAANAGTGIWIDRTGLFALDAGTYQVKIDATDGKLYAGGGNTVLDASGIGIDGLESTGSPEGSPSKAYKFYAHGTMTPKVYIYYRGENNVMSDLIFAVDDFGTVSGKIKLFKDTYASYDVRIGGGLYVGGIGTDPAAGTITATDYVCALGGLHVGGTSDPGTDNLWVDGLFRTVKGSELTISAAGAITVTASYHQVDTYEDGVLDSLDTINGGSDGTILILRCAHTDRTVRVKHGTGNINLDSGNNFDMDNPADVIMLVCVGSSWLELSRGPSAWA